MAGNFLNIDYHTYATYNEIKYHHPSSNIVVNYPKKNMHFQHQQDVLQSKTYYKLSIRKHGWNLIMQFSKNANAKDCCFKGNNYAISLQSSSIS